MRKIRTHIKGLYILKGKKFIDSRGWLREVFKRNYFNKNNIFTIVSKSKKNVLRGLHLQKKNSQDKLITVLKGKILDVAVDLRTNSKTFGKHHKIILSDTNCKSFFVPKGFAHGVLGLDKENIILYTCTNYRDKANEVSIIWNDKDLNIKWGIKKPILSAKDSKAQKITQFIKNFNEKKDNIIFTGGSGKFGKVLEEYIKIRKFYIQHQIN